MLFEFVRLVAPIVSIYRRFALTRDIWPNIGELSVHLEILIGAVIRIRANGFNRAFGLANPAIDAFIWVDHEHIVTLVEAIHRAYFDTVHEFTFDARIVDDVRHTDLRVFLDRRRREVWPILLKSHGFLPRFRSAKLVFFKASTNNFYNPSQ